MKTKHALYQQLILDHGRNPRNFGEPDNFDLKVVGDNPLCGDRFDVFISENEKGLTVEFAGSGCAISTASASLMCEFVKNKNRRDVVEFAEKFLKKVKGEEKAVGSKMGKLSALLGVKEFPARVKCATLSWHILLRGLDEVDS